MKDYTKGVFECLSWIEAYIDELNQDEVGWEQLKKEIGSTISDIRRGVGLDFRHRLKAQL